MESIIVAGIAVFSAISLILLPADFIRQHMAVICLFAVCEIMLVDTFIFTVFR